MGGKLHSDAVLVVGLGRFGAAAADALHRLGHEVLAVERNPELVQEWSGRLTHVVEADATNLEALKQIGAGQFPIAVVGIGTSIEASVLSTLNLVDLKVDQIWAKAISQAHGTILERLATEGEVERVDGTTDNLDEIARRSREARQRGVPRRTGSRVTVVFPEATMGERTAHLVTGKLLDYIEFDDGFAIVKMAPPRETHNFTLDEAGVRSKYGITVVGVKRPGEDFTYAIPSTKVHPDDTLIVSGHVEQIEAFAARP
ncbi:potassium channel family protein [Aquipuribacter sp. SD81]|uniref:potassium channel family protein n=1 Tax=Aquipuribacter sp. SD81 TaxID=3127703 RepID=UPI00301816F9